MRATPATFALIAATVILSVSSASADRAGYGLTTYEVHYVGAGLDAQGLSLSNDAPLLDMEFEQGEDTPFHSGVAVRKNPMVAMLLSCAVPGLGEMYVGETTRGGWFMATEAGIWLGYGAFQVQAGMREDDYKEFAEIYADVDAGSSSDYLSDIGDYIRNEGDRSYNESVRREARSLFPDDLDAQAAYLAANGYFGDDAWDWGSKDIFYEYRDLRRDASQSERNAFYMTGLAVLNRVLSAVDSAWMARRHNAGDTSEPGARLSVVPEYSEGVVGGRATLTVSF